MFEATRFWYRQRLLSRRYQPLSERAKGNPDEARQIDTEWAEESLTVDEDRRRLTQRRLLRKARRFFIPTPPLNEDNWEGPIATVGMPFLTEKATYELISEIHKAQKVRQELWLAWLPLVTAITGLIGTAIGLLALIHKLSN